jgi:uncharacterized protein (DUF433 family)
MIDWEGFHDVEVIPGKVSGAPLLRHTRLPVAAITENYDAFLDEGSSPEEALIETFDCYPEIDIERIKAVLAYRDAHEPQLQP